MLRPLAWFARTVSTVLLAIAPIAATAAPPPLPHLGADPNNTTVSGLSSGGFMAVQYAVAYSDSTTGAGIIAGGPYGCIRSLLSLTANPIEDCMKGERVSGAGTAAVARTFEAYGWIDALKGVARQRIYLFHGTTDTTVSSATMDALRDFYLALGVPRANLIYLDKMAAGHAFLSASGAGCPAKAVPPYVQRCPAIGRAYDQPGAILHHVLGHKLNPRVRQLSAVPEPFAQPPVTGLDSTGYIYVPRACRDEQARCAVHVVFHGCMQGAGEAGIGDTVYGRLGYNAWADSNRLIVLYPQVKGSPLAGNPYGCWDWWGYTAGFTSRYLDRRAPQLAAVRNMIEELAMPAQ